MLYFVVWKYTTPTNYLLEEDVIVPVHVRKELGIEGVSGGVSEEKINYVEKDKKDGVVLEQA